jgi:WD40 repeat protein
MITTGANNFIRTWIFDESTKKLKPSTVSISGSLRRNFSTISVSPTDTLCYLGTTTGDFMEIDLSTNSSRRIGPTKNGLSPQFPWAMGITCAQLIPGGGDYIIGSGDGTIAKISLNTLRVIGSVKLGPSCGSITSISITPDGTYFFVGSMSANIYWVETESLKYELRSSNHTHRVNSIAFPNGLIVVMASAAGPDIRVWNTRMKTELLTIQVPGNECLHVRFMPDGKGIVSGWSDGKIRMFTPQTGKLIFAIENAHNGGVTAISNFSDCTRIVSGGAAGEIRVWRITRSSQILEKSLKEHKSKVTAIDMIRGACTDICVRCVTCSIDGSCIVWDLSVGSRLLCVFEPTSIKSVAFSLDGGSQFLACGGDGKVYYYDTIDGELLRVLTVGNSELSCLSLISNDRFVVCSVMGDVALYDYDAATVVSRACAGSGGVSASAIGDAIVTGTDDGSMYFWALPPA